MKKIFGFIFLLVGIISIFSSFYIKEQVSDGLKKISQVERQLDVGDKLLSLAPPVQDQVDGMTGSIQEKVQEGKEQVVFYSGLAKWLEIFGIGFLVVGAWFVFCCKKRA